MQTVFTLMNNECQGSDIAIYVCELARNVECSCVMLACLKLVDIALLQEMPPTLTLVK